MQPAKTKTQTRTHAPLFSIIVPVFNQQPWLNDCLGSVLSQSVSDWEVWVVDDGSTDESARVAAEWAAKDPRVNLLQQANAGAGVARNVGLKAARGRYVQFLDADDWLEPGALASWKLALAQHPGAEVCFCNYHVVDMLKSTTQKVDLFGLKPGEMGHGSYVSFKNRLLTGAVVPWNKLMAREWLLATGAVFDPIPYANDRSFHFKVVPQIKSAVLLDAPLVNYRINNAGSLTFRAGLKRLESVWMAFKSITQHAKRLPDEDQRTIFEKNMEDVTNLYQHAPVAEKREIAQSVMREVNGGWMPYGPSECASSDWWCVFEVMRAVATTAGQDCLPLVFAVNAKYVPHLNVALQSVSETLASNQRAVAFVLHLGLPRARVEWLENELLFPNLQIVCINMQHALQLDGMQLRAHYAPEIYLRLWIPELLAVFPKVLYLDADVVVQKCVGTLLAADVLAHEVAGVRDFNNAGHFEYVENELGIAPQSYINSGVMLFNTARCVAADFRARCMQVLTERPKLSCPDQDAINLACAGAIGLLDSGWNYLWNYGFKTHRLPPDGEAYFSEDFAESKSKQYIVHFSSAIKPWNEPVHEDADIYWAVARRCESHGDIVRQACGYKLNAIRAMIQKNQ